MNMNKWIRLVLSTLVFVLILEFLFGQVMAQRAVLIKEVESEEENIPIISKYLGLDLSGKNFRISEKSMISLDEIGGKAMPGISNILAKEHVSVLSIDDANLYQTNSDVLSLRNKRWNVNAYFGDSSRKLIKVVLTYVSKEPIRIGDPWEERYEKLFEFDPSLVFIPDTVKFTLVNALNSPFGRHLLRAEEIEAFYVQFQPVRKTSTSLRTPSDSTPVWLVVAKIRELVEPDIPDTLLSQNNSFVHKVIYQVINQDTTRQGRRVTISPSQPWMNNFDRFPSLKKDRD